MTCVNTVTYAIELTPENAPKIDAINRILLTGSYNAISDVKAEPATEIKAKAEPATEIKAKAEPATDVGSMTFAEFKEAAKKAKANHGEEFSLGVLKAAGVEVKSTLGRSMSAVDKSSYQLIADIWAEGPIEDDDDLGDDDLGDDEAKVDPEAVKLALKAYAKEHGRDEAKELMTKYKVVALSKVTEMNQEDLNALFKELV